MRTLACVLCFSLLVSTPAFAQTAPPPPAAPSPSTVAGEQTSSEDTDAPSPVAGPGGSKEPPFYRPTRSELANAPPPAGYPNMLTILEDTHLFVNGSIRNFGDETRLRYGGNFGVTVGTFNFNTLGAGFDAFRYNGVRIVRATPGGFPFSMYILLPNLDIRAYAMPGRWGAAIGTSVTGLRMANCGLTGCFEASLRLGTVDAWGAGDFNQASFALSVGGGLSVGIKL